MKYDIITIGGATEDITFYTTEGLLISNRKDIQRQKLMAFEYGTKIKIDNSHSNFGGGAANAAVCASRFGLKTATLIAVGIDNRGEAIIENLRSHGVDTRFVQRSKKEESGFSFLLVGPDNEHIVFSNRAANSDLIIGQVKRWALDLSRWAYLTSLSGNWQRVLEQVFRSETKIAWNPGHIQLLTGIKVLEKYIKKTNVLILNKDEAIELVVSDRKHKNKPFKFLNNVRNLIKIIHSYGPEMAVITDGENGAYAYDGKKLFHKKAAKKKKIVDTTGVGDAFGASLVVGLHAFKGDIERAMTLGVLNAASVISKEGAQCGLLNKSIIAKL